MEQLRLGNYTVESHYIQYIDIPSGDMVEFGLALADKNVATNLHARLKIYQKELMSFMAQDSGGRSISGIGVIAEEPKFEEVIWKGFTIYAIQAKVKKAAINFSKVPFVPKT
mgnify:CR=1 FL=1